VWFDLEKLAWIRVSSDPVEHREQQTMVPPLQTTTLALTKGPSAIASAKDEEETRLQGAQIQADSKIEVQCAGDRSVNVDQRSTPYVERLQTDAGADKAVAKAASGAVPVSDLIGRLVISADGELLGRVSNFLLGTSGEIECLIIASSGFLGVGGREVTIPWSDTEFSTRSDEIRVTLTKPDIENAAQYERIEDNAFVGSDDQ
jgi:sporulation protein YlmC with PRC-barrel domain